MTSRWLVAQSVFFARPPFRQQRAFFSRPAVASRHTYTRTHTHTNTRERQRTRTDERARPVSLVLGSRRRGRPACHTPPLASRAARLRTGHACAVRAKEERARESGRRERRQKAKHCEAARRPFPASHHPLPVSSPFPISYEKFVLPEGVKKVTHARDTRVEHAATFTIQREDHTIGNLVRTALHRDGEVTFAGYRVPHPLEHVVVVKVATRGRRTPKAVLGRCLADLADAVEDCRNAFEASVAGAGGVGGGGGY